MNLSTDCSTNFLKNRGELTIRTKQTVIFHLLSENLSSQSAAEPDPKFCLEHLSSEFFNISKTIKKNSTVSGTTTDSLRDSQPSLPFDFPLYKFLFTPLTTFAIGLQLNMTLRISICHFSRQQ